MERGERPEPEPEPEQATQRKTTQTPRKMVNRSKYCVSFRPSASLLCYFLLLCHAFLLDAIQGLDLQPSSATKTCRENTCRSLLDVDRLIQTVNDGRVYQQENFLSQSQIQWLLQDIHRLEEEGALKPSGLSNTIVQKQNQNFGDRDRKVSPVPWWNPSSNEKDETTPTTTSIMSQLNDLRQTLADLLNRTTMKDPALAHECYYSKSSVGSFLPRHMDERHEEFKGTKGWLLPSRRSLSWLIYLSDPDWDLDSNGGALRTFPQPKISSNSIGSHMGNLQVGWLLENGTGGARPVYLDSWFPLETPLGKEPHCVLYTVDDEQNQIRLTQPWSNDSLQGISVAEFCQTWAERDSTPRDDGQQPSLFVDSQYAKQFALLEDRAAWDDGSLPQGSITEDISPIRGSLVVFDSVTVPHEVEKIKEGTRIALAGWFHEETQQFPSDLFA